MRFSTIASASVLAATALGAPAAECNAPPPANKPVNKPGHVTRHRPSKPTTAATVSFPATCTAVVTSVATSTTVITETEYAPPGATDAPTPGGMNCVTDEDAADLAEVFRQLIQDYSDELALTALTEDFVDYSSAVNILMNKGAQYPKNITGATFASRQAFMDGQGSQPKIPFTTLNVFHGCDSVSVRWMTERSANGQKTEAAMVPVVGNGIMHVVPAEESNESYNFRIKELYSEFNAAAWLINLGVFVPEGPVDYINAANSSSNATVAKRGVDSFDASFRGAAI